MYERGNSYGYSWLWIVVVVVFIVVIFIVFYAASGSQSNPLFLNPRANIGKSDLLNLPNTVLPLALGKTPLRNCNLKCPKLDRRPIFENLQTAEEAQKIVVFPQCELLKASVRLCGSNEVDKVKTTGKGKGYIYIDSSKEVVSYNIHIKHLSSSIEAVHFHLGGRDANGPILKDLVIVESKDAEYYHLKGVWTPNDENQPLTQENLDALLAGEVYVNIHTVKYANGEIRDQLHF